MNDVIIEFIVLGNVVKVTAVDAVTGEEASIVGDPSASREELKRLATQKLVFVKKKKVEQSREKSTKDGSSKGGIIV